MSNIKLNIQHRRKRLYQNTMLILTSLIAGSGCATKNQIQGTSPVRAIWVTRWDYKTTDDVRQIVRNCGRLGITTILFQVRGNGTVFYPSSIEPWAEEFGYSDPGFDPLDLAIEEAHAADIQLHAWINVMPAWRGKNAPEYEQQLYHTHPEWFLFDQNGHRQPLTDHYVILNPCLPEVRAYLTTVFQELCLNYDLDGLHMDYIRFVTHGSGAGTDYPYDENTLKLYRKATGKCPDDDQQAWDDWRRNAVTHLVADIHNMIKTARPKAKLTAAVFGDRSMVREKRFQEGDRWLKEGLIDMAFPMIYTENTDDFVRMAEDWRRHSYGKPLVPGIGVYKHEDDATSIEQIQRSWSWGNGFCLFAYSSFFPKSPPSGEQLDLEQLERENKRCQLRLNNLKPVLLNLSNKQETIDQVASLRSNRISY